MGMANITYKIQEKFQENNVDIDQLLNDVNLQHETLSQNSADQQNDVVLAMELDYTTNYNVKELGLILDYYEISKRKMRKDEMVQTIILFEDEKDNIAEVERRKMLWSYINELKNDKFFSKYILFNT